MPRDPSPTTIIPGYGPDDFATAVIAQTQKRLALANPPQSLSEHEQEMVREAIVWCIITYGRVE